MRRYVSYATFFTPLLPGRYQPFQCCVYLAVPCFKVASPVDSWQTPKDLGYGDSTLMEQLEAFSASRFSVISTCAPFRYTSISLSGLSGGVQGLATVGTRMSHLFLWQ